MARKVGITATQVIDAAAAIADRDGLEAVSLATVASALEVRPPSLYSHVDGVGGLRRALGCSASRLLAEQLAEAAAGHDDARQALVAIAHTYRDFALAHRGQYAALLPAPKPNDDPDVAAAFAAPIGVVAAVLSRLGIAPERHVDQIRALRALLHGFCDLELGGGFGLADPIDVSFTLAVDLLVDALVVTTGAGAPSDLPAAPGCADAHRGRTPPP